MRDREYKGTEEEEGKSYRATGKKRKVWKARSTRQREGKEENNSRREKRK